MAQVDISNFVISPEWRSTIQAAGMTEQQFREMLHRGKEAEAKRLAARATKEISIDKELHDRLKVKAKKLGMKPFYALAMAVEAFLDDDADTVSPPNAV